MELPVLTRECGPCTACCVAPCAEDLGKPGNVPCKDLCSAGCSIYDSRPKVCRIFQCGWKVGLGSDLERPDVLGIMFSITEKGSRIALEIYELRRDALKQNLSLSAVEALIASFVNAPMWDVRIYPYGVPTSQEDRYPIDAAYKQTQVVGDYVMGSVQMRTGGTLLVHVGCISIPGGDLYLRDKYIDRKYAPRYMNDSLYMRKLICDLC